MHTILESNSTNTAHIWYDARSNSQVAKKAAVVDLQTEIVSFFDFNYAESKGGRNEPTIHQLTELYDDIQVVGIRKDGPSSCGPYSTWYFYDKYPLREIDFNKNTRVSVANTGGDRRNITAFKVLQTAETYEQVPCDLDQLGYRVVTGLQLQEFWVLTGEPIRTIDLNIFQIWEEIAGIKSSPYISTESPDSTSVPTLYSVEISLPATPDPTSAPMLSPMAISLPIPTTINPPATTAPTKSPLTLSTPRPSTASPVTSSPAIIVTSKPTLSPDTFNPTLGSTTTIPTETTVTVAPSSSVLSRTAEDPSPSSTSSSAASVPTSWQTIFQLLSLCYCILVLDAREPTLLPSRELEPYLWRLSDRSTLYTQPTLSVAHKVARMTTPKLQVGPVVLIRLDCSNFATLFD